MDFAGCADVADLSGRNDFGDFAEFSLILESTLQSA
jgi:hypothetical protein